MKVSLQECIGCKVVTSDKRNIGLALNGVINKKFEASLVVMPGLQVVDLESMPALQRLLNRLFGLFSQRVDGALEDSELGTYIEVKDEIFGWLVELIDDEADSIRDAFFQIPVNQVESIGMKRVVLKSNSSRIKNDYYLLSAIPEQDLAFYSHEQFAKNWHRGNRLDLGLTSIRHSLISDSEGDHERLMDIIVDADKGVAHSFSIDYLGERKCVPTNNLQKTSDPEEPISWSFDNSFEKCQPFSSIN